MNISERLARFIYENNQLRKSIPKGLKKLIITIAPIDSYIPYFWAHSNPYIGTEYEWSHKGSNKQELGIIYDFTQEHKNYIAACLEMSISYKVIDISRNNWVNIVNDSGIRAFLAWPWVYTAIWKEIFEERIHIMIREMAKIVYPSFDEILLYESKRKIVDWLKAYGFPLPETRVFLDKKQASEFTVQANYPLVFKTDLGSASSGVILCKDQKEAKKLICLSFTKGVALKGRDPRDRHWGYIIFQEFIPHRREWRIIRVGDAYFCQLRMRRGTAGSGLGEIIWGKPPRELLDLSKKITDRGRFTSMAIDYIETAEGKYLVNELHTVFGEGAQSDNNLEGKYLYEEKTNEWLFQKGDYSRNRCANLRVDYILKLLAKEQAGI